MGYYLKIKVVNITEMPMHICLIVHCVLLPNALEFAYVPRIAVISCDGDVWWSYSWIFVVLKETTVISSH